ncbi:MAG: OmpH family outer membrane protein [Pedosphaera sp.]|nr:OmpH family outer membrane protein [Pedosphaera sp.]
MMKRHFGYQIFLGLALGLLTYTHTPVARAADAQPKIATTNLRKIFEGYFKTKQADLQLKERGAEAEKVLKGMLDDYQKASDEYKTFSAGLADQAVSAEERDKRKKSAEAKLSELQEIERSVKHYRSDNLQRLEDQKKRMRENVLRDIREKITIKAKAGAFNLVLDSSAETINQTDVVLFNNGLTDLTEEIITELNANAPPNLSGIEKDEKKDGKKGEKK